MQGEIQVWRKVQWVRKNIQGKGHYSCSELQEFCVLENWVQRMEPLVGRKGGLCAFLISVD